MSELILSVGSFSPGDPTKFQDGDIVEAFNDNKISRRHISTICHIRNNPFNRDGFNLLSGITARYYKIVAERMFTRVGPALIKIDQLQEPFGSSIVEVPGILDYIKTRMKHENHRIFGTHENEVWFGNVGRNLTPATIPLIWNMIETHSNKRKIHHDKWPLSPYESSALLALSVDDMSDGESDDLVTPELDVDNAVVRRRRHKVVFELLDCGCSLDDIRNKNKSIDVRSYKKHLRKDIVEPRI